MKKILSALLCILLLLTGCGSQPPEPIVAAPPTAEGPASVPEAEAKEPVILYDCGTVKIALPLAHKQDLIVKQGAEDCLADQPLYPRTLLSVYEKASVEAAEKDFGSGDGFGFLWGFAELDEATLAEYVETSPGGCTVFAEKDGLYYVYLTPTDVQLHRSDMAALTPDSEDFRLWETLNELGETVREDMVERNKLNPFTPPAPQEFPSEKPVSEKQPADGTAQEAPTVQSPPAEAPPQAPKTEPLPVETVAAAAMAGPLTTYTCGGIKIALPAAYLPLLLLEGGEFCTDEHACTLLSVCEKASAEAAKTDFGAADGMGFLFGIQIMDQAGMEQFIQYETAGCHVFARSDTHYFAKTYPTDVRFYRSGGYINTTDEDWRQWEILNALGDAVCADIVERNGLTPYSMQELLERPFTWESEHAYVSFYPDLAETGSKDNFRTLVLSQPAAQGEGGIWCVERVVDSFGNVYLRFPESDLPAAEYYAALQAECNTGAHPELLTPLGASAAFVEARYQGTVVTEENLVSADSSAYTP